MAPKKRAVLAAAMILAMVFLAAYAGLSSVLLSSMISHFQLTDASKGLQNTAQSIGSIVALIGSFFILGRISKTKLLCIVVGGCVALLSLLKMVPTYSLFLILWVVMGLCTSLIDSLTSSCMANLYTGEKASRMMSALHLLYSVACILYPLLFNALLSGGMAWNSIYLVVAGVGLTVLVYILFATRKSNQGDSPVTEQKLTAREIVAALRKGTLPGLIVIMFCNGFYMGGMGWINRYVSEVLGSNLGGIAISFVFFGVTLSRLVMTFTSLSPEKYVRFGALLAGVVLLIALPLKNAVVMCAAVSLCGLCYGAMIPCLMSIACAILPQNTLLVTTVLGLTNAFSQGLVSPVIGALESTAGLGAGIGLCAVFMILTSLGCMAMLRKTHKNAE